MLSSVKKIMLMCKDKKYFKVKIHTFSAFIIELVVCVEMFVNALQLAYN